MEFAKRLKQLRSEKGISQTKLAADIHISRSAVAKWENGLGMPSDESLQMLAEYFGVAVDELIPKPEASRYSDAFDIPDDHVSSKKSKMWIRTLIVILGCSLALLLMAIVLLLCLNPLIDVLRLLAVGFAVIIIIGIPVMGFVGTLLMAVFLILQLVKLLKVYRGHNTIGVFVFYCLLFFGILLGIVGFCFWVPDSFALTTLIASAAPCLMWCLIYVYIAFRPIVQHPEKHVSIFRTVACSVGFVINLLLLTIPIQFWIFDGDFSGVILALCLLLNAMLTAVQALIIAVAFVAPRFFKHIAAKKQHA
ncbi:MAG: helix-turn-helix transcriptional regulator [Clostridia bacterium]|nr:helix-turn-helix transcriptional regulator [Clostridia bacterium]